MKKLLIAIAILMGTFLAAAILTQIAGAYSWKHVLGGGLYGSTGVPFKVESDGTLYLTD